MSLINYTPFPSIVWDSTDANGNEFTTALVRVAYRLKEEKGEYVLTLKSDQGELFGENIYYDNGEEIRYPSDFVPYKPYVDIILNAKAYPHNQGSEGLYCTIALVNETFETIHENTLALLKPGNYKRNKWLGMWKFEESGSLHPFPLRYSYGYGGEIIQNDSQGNQTILKRLDENPVGKGLLDKNHPNETVETPLFTDTVNPNHSNGFGAIDPSWSPRCEYVGKYDDSWKEDQFPLLPIDFDPMFYHSAHPKMIFKGNTDEIHHIRFNGIHPNKWSFTVKIPDLHPIYREEDITYSKEYPLQIDTLLFDFDDDSIDNWNVFVCYRNRNKSIKSLKKQKIVFLSKINVK